jgi:hypothetical protein
MGVCCTVSIHGGLFAEAGCRNRTDAVELVRLLDYLGYRLPWYGLIPEFGEKIRRCHGAFLSTTVVAAYDIADAHTRASEKALQTTMPWDRVFRVSISQQEDYQVRAEV